MAVADLTRFQEAINQSKSASLILPQNGGQDSTAAGLALYLSLNKKGIATSISSPSPMTVEASRIVGVDKVREDLGDKNLVVSFAGYPAEGIEKVSYNIEENQFSLTVIPKPGNSAPTQDQVRFAYSGLASDLLIVVGANYPQDLGKFGQRREIVDHPNKVVLGNEPLSGWPRSIELIDVSGASISEVAFDVILGSNLPLDSDIATNLFLGIEAGTRNFTSKKASAATFEKASRLLKEGAQRLPGQGGAREEEALPKDWFTAPKVYKGSTLP